MAYVKEYTGNWLARLRETTKNPHSGQLVSGYKLDSPLCWNARDKKLG